MSLIYKEHAQQLAALATSYLAGTTSSIEFVRKMTLISAQMRDVSAPAPPQRPSFEWKQYAADTQMIQWCEAHDCTLPGRKPWRWLPAASQRLGEINGLPGSRGTPRITDGVEVLIELEDGSIYIGHLAWFINEPKEPNWSLRAERRAERQKMAELRSLCKAATEGRGTVTKEDVLALLK